MRRHRARSIGLVIALLLTGLLPAAGLTAPPAAPTQVNVAGSFEETIGGANWTNNDPLTDLADANGLSAPYVIFPGQAITIPGE